mgnify:CR=1 FL=1
MKKLFAILAVMGVLSFGMTQTAMAQDSTATAAPEQNRTGLHLLQLKK